ncbi:MAG: DUF4238 domain-containing protein [Gallionella sp.]|nr:DUF4238 domain-containing protein [Gallionella sp.]
MPGQAIKHHYIPQFILRKFCNESGQLHIYNSQYKKINPKTFTPKQVCYEPDLHTLIHGNEKFFDIETGYSKLEGEFSEMLTKIEEYVDDNSMLDEIHQSEDAAKIINFFIVLSFWRNPARSKLAARARRNLRQLYNHASKENKAMVEYERKFLHDIERKGGKISEQASQFLFLPLLTAQLDGKIIGDCWFYKSSAELILSEDPIYFSSINDNFVLDGDIYLPISPNLCITNSPSKIADFQKFIFSNSRHKVIARSREILEDNCRINGVSLC